MIIETMNRLLVADRGGTVKTGFFLILTASIFLLNPEPAAASDEGRGSAHAQYESEMEYSGRYRVEGLYMRRSSTKAFTGYQDPSRLSALHCLDARLALESKGRWKGNLNADGTCADPGDPAQWVTGNYLNFRTGR